MINRRVGHALLFLAASVGILLTAVPAARADSEVRIVRLSYVTGDVQMDRGTGQGFERAVMNMPVTRGSRVWAGDDGYAEVEFEEGSTVRLTPGTGLNVTELSLRSDGGHLSMVEVQQGIAYFDIRPSNADEFRVTVTGYDLQVQRHTHFRVSVEQDTVRVAVFDGTLVVPSGDGRIEVGKNQTLTLDLSNPRYRLVRSVSEDPYDQWDHDRANYRDNYQAGSGSYDPGYSASYSYGVSDLNYWGNYSYINGWGYMWQPYNAGFGWNPWMDGAWVWYPGLGYMWVSAYPWGWMPYRYGGWYFISGHGWCWRPEHHWNRWVAVTPVHNAPANFSPPQAPAGSGPHVIPVGRGPATLIPNPNDREWRGPRRPLDPGAPGAPVRLGRTPAGGPATGTPAMGSGGSGGSVGAPAVGAAPTLGPGGTPSGPASDTPGSGAGAGSFRRQPEHPVAPSPMRPVMPNEGVTPPPAAAPQPPSNPVSGPPSGAGPGTYKQQPVRPVSPIPMRPGDEGASAPAATPQPEAPPRSRWHSDETGAGRGTGGSQVSSPSAPASVPAPPPPSSGPAQSSGWSGGGRSSGGSGGSGGSHASPPPPPPPSQPHSSGGGASGGGSHSSGSSQSSSSSSGSKSPK